MGTIDLSVKINFVILKAQLLFRASPVSIRTDMAEISVCQKVQTDGQTDRQTDGFSALYSRFIGLSGSTVVNDSLWSLFIHYAWNATCCLREVIAIPCYNQLLFTVYCHEL